MSSLKVLAIHGCCLGDHPEEKVTKNIRESTERALAAAGHHDVVIKAPFYGALLDAYANADYGAFAASLGGGLESAIDEAELGGNKAALTSLYESVSGELHADAALEARLPIPDVVREIILHRFTVDVATYLTMLRAKEAIWGVITSAWREFGDTGPDLVVAHSLGTVVTWDVMARFGHELGRPKGLLLMGSPLYLSEVVKGVAMPPDTVLPTDKAIHIYDDGDLIAGGRPIAPPYTGITDMLVENKAFPTSHDYGPYAKAAADEGVLANLLA